MIDAISLQKLGENLCQRRRSTFYTAVRARNARTHRTRAQRKHTQACTRVCVGGATPRARRPRAPRDSHWVLANRVDERLHATPSRQCQPTITTEDTNKRTKQTNKQTNNRLKQTTSKTANTHQIVVSHYDVVRVLLVGTHIECVCLCLCLCCYNVLCGATRFAIGFVAGC